MKKKDRFQHDSLLLIPIDPAILIFFTLESGSGWQYELFIPYTYISLYTLRASTSTVAPAILSPNSRKVFYGMNDDLDMMMN